MDEEVWLFLFVIFALQIGLGVLHNVNILLNWLWTFKRNSIELILLNPTKFEQIRKFENFRMKKKMLKKVRKLKLPMYIHI